MEDRYILIPSQLHEEVRWWLREKGGYIGESQQKWVRFVSKKKKQFGIHPIPK